MKVLVAYASKHGGTRGIATRIAERLSAAGVDTRLIDMAQTDLVVGFDAAVVGSAVYMGRWMKDAIAFVRRNRSALRDRPLWLFSSGPVGPEPLPEAKDAADLRSLFTVLDHRTFDGVIDRGALSVAERLIVKAVKAPQGDFRNWDEIDSWAQTIAGALTVPARR